MAFSSFDAASFQLPEGLAVSGDRVAVGWAPTSEIVLIGQDGTASPFGQLPKLEPGTGFMTGLAFGDAGELYAGLVSFAEGGPPSGIYRVAPSGGKATLFAQHEAMRFPNGLAVHGGDLFVADSASGSVLRVALATGEVAQWAQSQLLVGDKDACPPSELPFDLGANGIAVAADGTVYVTNSDLATVVRIPRQPDGSAGVTDVFAGPACDLLEGGDGLAVTPSGELLVTANRLNKLVRVGTGGQVQVVVEGGVLDFPSNLAFRPDGTLLIANFAFVSAQTPGASPRPGILELRYDGARASE